MDQPQKETEHQIESNQIAQDQNSHKQESSWQLNSDASVEEGEAEQTEMELMD